MNGAGDFSRERAELSLGVRGAVRDVRTWLAALLLGAVVVAAYWPCFDNALVYNGGGGVAEGNPCDVGPRPARQPGALAIGATEPLTRIALKIDRALWGLRPRPVQVENVALHALNGVLVYVLGLVLFRLTQTRTAGPPALGMHLGAWLAAVLFALHPLRVEAVADAAQRSVLLATFFLLLSMLLYVRATAGLHGGRWLPAALICFALSLAAGSVGVTLPILLLLLDVYPLRRLGGGRGSWFGAAARGIWLEKTPFLVLGGAAIVLAIIASGQSPAGSRGDGAVRLAQALYGPGFYLLKTFWPIDLVPLYEAHWPPIWMSLDAIGSVAAWIVLVWLVVSFGRHTPALPTALAAYVVVLLPVPMLMLHGSEAAADRCSYLPSVACVLLIGSGITRLWSMSGRDVRLLAGGATVAGLVVAGGLGVLTWRQCGVWRDPLTLWTYAAQRCPESAPTLYRLAQQFDQTGESERAQQTYAAAINCRRSLLPAYHAQAADLLQLSRPDEAAEVFRRALKVDPQCAETQYQLGVALAADGQFDPAEASLRRAKDMEPNSVAPRSALGHLLMVEQRWAEAAEAFRSALALDPHNADLEYDLGRAYERDGQAKDAADAFRRALASDPEHKLARRALAEIGTSQPSSSAAPG